MLTTIDLFCGAGGITEGFRQAGFKCLYGNDCAEQAMKTFAANHPKAVADCRTIEKINAREIRQKLGLLQGELSVLAGGLRARAFRLMRRGDS